MATFVFIGIIWWCIEHYDLQMVAFWFIVFIFALTFTLTYISALYPEIYEFFVNLYGSFGKFVYVVQLGGMDSPEAYFAFGIATSSLIFKQC